MTAKIQFYPIGNADTLRIDLEDGRKILVDYANMRCPDDNTDLRCDLPAELRRDLTKSRRNDYDAVCITHTDKDHCKGFGDFFWLEHAATYQNDDRVRIKELWVPAAAIMEENLTDDARLVRTEARYRLIEGKGIRVFSRPERLKQWLDAKGLDFESRKHLIVNAGETVPGYAAGGHEQAEFFVHCPFGWHVDDSPIIDRNEASIVMQVTFREGGQDYYMLLGSDVDYAGLSEIVYVTRHHRRDDRLLWDILKLPHHCSYLALSNERGTEETVPVPNVKWLLETQGRNGGIIISPSCPIPSKDSADDASIQPPHRQAANYHRRVRGNHAGEFIVTMEFPSRTRPEPFAYKITALGVAPDIAAPMISISAAAATPRAG